MLSGTIQYLDAAGAVVYSDYLYVINLAGGQTITVNNSSLIDASLAPRVASIQVTID